MALIREVWVIDADGANMNNFNKLESVLKKIKHLADTIDRANVGSFDWMRVLRKAPQRTVQNVYGTFSI